MELNKKKIQIAMANVCVNAYELCKKADLPYPTFSKVYSGKSCKPATAGKIAKALNVSVEELMED